MSDDKPDKKKKAKSDDATVTVSIAAHPRAKAGIRRVRTRAAFGAFMLVLALNLIGHQDLFDALWRALLAGIIVNVIVWRCAIVVWKHVIVSEVRQEEERRLGRVPVQRGRQEQPAADRADTPARAA